MERFSAVVLLSLRNIIFLRLSRCDVKSKEYSYQVSISGLEVIKSDASPCIPSTIPLYAVLRSPPCAALSLRSWLPAGCISQEPYPLASRLVGGTGGRGDDVRKGRRELLPSRSTVDREWRHLLSSMAPSLPDTTLRMQLCPGALANSGNPQPSVPRADGTGGFSLCSSAG